MTRDEAVAIACERCVTVATMLAAARLPIDADDQEVGRVLAAGVVCGWADDASVGSADARGITVRERGGVAAIPVRWSQVAALVRPALRQPGVADRLTELYGRYVAAATDTSVASRLGARAASGELASMRCELLELAHARAPVQQALFALPPMRARPLARGGPR